MNNSIISWSLVHAFTWVSLHSTAFGDAYTRTPIEELLGNRIQKTFAVELDPFNLDAAAQQESLQQNHDVSKMTVNLYDKESSRAVSPLDGSRLNLSILFQNTRKNGLGLDFLDVLNEEVLDDLKLFSGTAKFPRNSLLEAIDQTSTNIGKMYLGKLLAQPIVDIDILEGRQKLIKFFLNNPLFLSHLKVHLDRVKANELQFLNFWDASDPVKTPGMKSALKLIAGSPSKALSKRKGFLEFKRRGIDLILVSNTLLIFPMLYILPMLKVRKAQIRFIRHRLKPSQNIQLALKEISNMSTRIPYDIKSLLTHVDKIDKFFENSASEMLELQRLLAYKKINSDHNNMIHTGKLFAAYNLFEEHKENYVPPLIALAELDAFSSIALFINKINSSKKNSKAKVTFAKYIDNVDAPQVKMDKYWNLLIPKSKAVVNSIAFGGQCVNNAIITGPNAGGKSTSLTAIASNLVLAQTLGFATGTHVEITPFNRIFTHLNITDDVVAEQSLFKAEVDRAAELIRVVEASGPQNFVFSVMDEVFNGTNPTEGQVGSYAIAEYVSQFPASISLIATHYPLTTQLESLYPQRFKNYKVSVDFSESGKILYNYKLSGGISDQKIAIKILREEGFNEGFLDRAEELLDAK